MRHPPAISIYGYVGGRQIAKFFLGQSIGVEETNKF